MIIVGRLLATSLAVTLCMGSGSDHHDNNDTRLNQCHHQRHAYRQERDEYRNERDEYRQERDACKEERRKISEDIDVHRSQRDACRAQRDAVGNERTACHERRDRCRDERDSCRDEREKLLNSSGKIETKKRPEAFYAEWESRCPSPSQIIPAIYASGTDIPRGTPYRSLRTVPPGFVIRKSSIPGAGLGVFATTFFRKNTWLGVYDGEVFAVDEGANIDYSWIIPARGRVQVIDGADDRISNWLRFVNCPRHQSEENVRFHACFGQVLYRTFRDLYPGVELMIFYGPGYGQRLGINMTEYYSPLNERLPRAY